MNFEVALEHAKKSMEVLVHGGVIIIPVYEGYGIFGASEKAVDRIFAAKRRSESKSFTLLGNRALQKEIHSVSPKASQLIDAVTLDLSLALGVVSKANADHPMVRKSPPGALAKTVRNGKVNIILNSGLVMEHLAIMSIREQLPVFGTSANLTGRGLKGRVNDIEQVVRDISDYTVDAGSLAGYSSSIIDVDGMTTLRYGYRYEEIQQLAKRDLDIALPDFPLNVNQ